MADAKGTGPNSYEIVKAELTAHRAPGFKFDIKDAIASIILYEHLELPYMTGKLIVIDTVDIFGLVGFQGTEILEFEAIYSKDDTSNGSSITKKFVVTSISKSQKMNDNTDGIILNLTEEHFFKNKIEVISRAYDGKPNEIIKALFEDAELDKEIEILGDIEIQEPLKYLVPYTTPMEAAMVVKESATTVEGYPYFLYSTIADPDKLYYTNLGYLLDQAQSPMSRTPFTYALYATGKADEDGDIYDPRNPNAASQANQLDLEERSRFIEKYSVTNTQNTINFMQRGHIGSTNEYVNVNQFEYDDYRHDMYEQLELLKDKFPNDQNLINYDRLAFSGDLHMKDGRYNTRLYASHLYSDAKANIYDTGTTLGENLKHLSTSTALKAFMEKSAIDVEVPSYLFWPRGFGIPGKTIGRRIPLRFFTNDVGDDDENREQTEKYDRDRSGEYLIYAASHNFSADKYSVSLTCVKYSNLRMT